MRTGLYTRIVLTIIAGCLCVLAVKSLKADPVIGSGQEILRVNLVQIGGAFSSVNDLRQLLRAKK